METENMKLLDSQTGKYLELGKDWFYGGKIIDIITVLPPKPYSITIPDDCIETENGYIAKNGSHGCNAIPLTA